MENYPTLTRESLRAVFAFATECMREESLYATPSRGYLMDFLADENFPLVTSSSHYGQQLEFHNDK